MNGVAAGKIKDSSLAMIERSFYEDPEFYKIQWKNSLEFLWGMMVDCFLKTPGYMLLTYVIFAALDPGLTREICANAMSEGSRLQEVVVAAAVFISGMAFFIRLWSLKSRGAIEFDDVYRKAIARMVRVTIGCEAKGLIDLSRVSDDGRTWHNHDYGVPCEE